jgi:serpin B
MESVILSCTRGGAIGGEMNQVQISNTVMNNLVTASTAFGFRLLAQLSKPAAGKNVFISAPSIALALAMTYNGAEGATRKAMAQTLGIEGLALPQINSACAALLQTLERTDPQVQLAIANSLWAKANHPFAPDFIQRTTTCFHAQIANIDFTAPSAPATINEWVGKMTNEKIRDLIKPGDFDDLTRLVLINAIFFKGIWQKQFDKAKTRDGIFTLHDGQTKQQPMMAQSGSFKYAESRNYQAVALPYGDGRVSMYIFLPTQTAALDEFASTLTATNWDKWMSRFSKMEGDLVLPRFKIEYAAELNDALAALGMSVAFGDDANFDGMSQLKPAEFYISKARHKTFVQVNEEGTQAAAATAVIIAQRAIVQRFRMMVDRPFFCAIRDDETGVLLFMGLIVDPN